MNKEDIYIQVSKELEIPEEVIKEAYESYWKFIKSKIKSLPLKEDLSEEEFSKYRTNFNIPSLGKLSCTFDRMESVKKRFEYLNKIKQSNGNNKKIKPMFNGVITTINKYKSDVKLTGTSLIDSTKAGSVKEYQTVVSVGPMVRDIKVGDVVYINPSRYAVKKHKEGSLKDGVITDNPTIGYDFDIVEIDGEPHLYLNDNDIKFIAEIEEFDENPTIVVPEKKVLL